MDKDIEKQLKKILIQTNEVGDRILNPNVVEIIKNEGYCVISDNLANKLLHESLELGKLKKELKENGHHN